jgi:hypothetical protein
VEIALVFLGSIPERYGLGALVMAIAYLFGIHPISRDLVLDHGAVLSHSPSSRREAK